MKLRPYQAEALKISKEKFDAGIRRQLVALPTGTGKTPLFASLPKHHGFTKRGLVLVHREELAQQAYEKVQKWNPDFRVGIEMGQLYAARNADVVVASVQTIGRSGSDRIKKFDPADFGPIICDEAHHSVSTTYRNVFEYFGLLGDGDPGRLLFGVTATPNRGDGQGLGQIYDEIIYQMSILDAIKQGWLVDVRGIKIKSDVSLDGVGTVAGDFNQGELESVINVEERNHLIVQSWLKHGEDRQTICFTVDIAHAKALANTFKAYGVACEPLWGNDPDRAAKLKYHREGHIRVLTNCGVLTEGYDDWRIGCVVLARPTKSQLLFVQMAGRGTRLPDGVDNLRVALDSGAEVVKKDCLLLDVVDTTSNHSLVTLPSIFGMGRKVDIKGKSVLKALEAFERAEQDNPTIDFQNLESIDDIKTYVENIDLYTIKWPEEVVQNAKLQWNKTPSGDYALSIPTTKELVIIYQDLLGKWNVKGTVMGNSFAQDGLDELPEAFRQAENFVTMFGRGLLTLMRRDGAKWHGEKATAPQLRLLRRLKIPFQPDITKGDASKLIGRHTNQRFMVRPSG